MNFQLTPLAVFFAFSILFLTSESSTATTVEFEASFVVIPAGTFTMGSPLEEEGRSENERPHQVTFTQDFEIQSTEMTQDQYLSLTGENPSHHASEEFCPEDFSVIQEVALCPSHPVENISWREAESLAARLSRESVDFDYTLPTEAQWEYAARAGSQTPFFFGGYDSDAQPYLWSKLTYNEQTHSTLSKEPNAFGLYQVHGNVWEWVQDRYAEYPLGPVIDPPAQEDGRGRVMRGSSSDYEPHVMRSAYRFYLPEDYKNRTVGIRLVRTPKN